jgi:hypothetical protein
MNVILYRPVIEENSKELLYRVIENLELEIRLEVHRTIGSLSHSLSQPKEDSTVAVLFAASKDELLNILSIRDLLFNVRIILVLPDREDDTIAKGHSLRPRFLTYVDSDSEKIIAVLGKMLGDIYPDEN